MVTDNWYFVTPQAAKSGVKECYAVNKVFLMFRVYIYYLIQLNWQEEFSI